MNQHVGAILSHSKRLMSFPSSELEKHQMHQKDKSLTEFRDTHNTGGQRFSSDSK